jgi:hypothetical protein
LVLATERSVLGVMGSRGRSSRIYLACLALKDVMITVRLPGAMATGECGVRSAVGAVG